MTTEANGFRLHEERAHPPRAKTYPVPYEDLGEGLVVAEDNGDVIGFAEVVFEPWNRRATIAHLYVAPANRGQGEHVPVAPGRDGP